MLIFQSELPKIRIRQRAGCVNFGANWPLAMFILFTRIALLFCTTGFCVYGAQFYNDWAAAHFNDLPGQSGPLADPDQDGQTNIVEFAFGTDPRLAGD